ncbi:glycosyltransferase family 2 protein [Candidatus Pacearchaeota archaeon]|nr:glycosyltransferase family 2 protein [Candidatus Pacearchaeota archaeon]
MKLSIIVPVYNEEKTIATILKRLISVKLGVSKEIIIIDDGSKDKSLERINLFKDNKKKDISVKIVSKTNRGKGSAIREGIKIATGEIITIQDADLEYDPSDYLKLIEEIKKGHLVVYGSRFLKKHKPLYKIYFYGNKFLTFLTQVLYNSKITDMETCYKMFKKEVIKSLSLNSNGFEIEPEITAKILNKGIIIKEVPIKYSPRNIKEGKKINWIDGLQAIILLIRMRFKD